MPVIPTWLCAAALAFMLALFVKKKFVKTRAVLAFVGSLGLAEGALGGWAPELLREGMHWVVLLGNKGLAILLAGFPLSIIVAVLAFFYLHDLWPKNAARLSTTIIGFILPWLILAAGLSASEFSAAAGPAPAGIVQAAPVAASITGGAPDAAASIVR